MSSRAGNGKELEPPQKRIKIEQNSEQIQNSQNEILPQQTFQARMLTNFEKFQKKYSQHAVVEEQNNMPPEPLQSNPEFLQQQSNIIDMEEKNFQRQSKEDDNLEDNFKDLPMFNSQTFSASLQKTNLTKYYRVIKPNGQSGMNLDQKFIGNQEENKSLIQQLIEILDILNKQEYSREFYSKVQSEQIVFKAEGHFKEGKQRFTYTTNAIAFEALKDICTAYKSDQEAMNFVEDDLINSQMYSQEGIQNEQEEEKKIELKLKNLISPDQLFFIDEQGYHMIYRKEVSNLRIMKAYTYTELKPSFNIEQFLKQKKPLQKPYQYVANSNLYSISRPRLQYLANLIPKFKFRHFLIEALMSQIYRYKLENPALPEFGTKKSVSLRSLIRIIQNYSSQPAFSSKYFDSKSHIFNKLLSFSFKGDTLGFIHYFNEVQVEQWALLAKYKIALYDINQRRYVICPVSGSKVIYFVHYNGFVFSTTIDKMNIIREREQIGLNKSQDLSHLSQLIQDDEGTFAFLLQSQQEPMIKQSSSFIEEQKISLSFEQPKAQANSEVQIQEFEEQEYIQDDFSTPYEAQSHHMLSNRMNEYSDIRVQKGYCLNPFLRGGKNLAKDKVPIKGSLLVFKTTYEEVMISENVYELVPKKLWCYGTLPNNQQPICQYFTGKNPHAQFILWLFSNTINYQIDLRQDQSTVNVFCQNGFQKDLRFLLEALINVCGRDAFFIGDINRLKCIWKENVRFYDFENLFQNQKCTQLAKTWLEHSELAALEQVREPNIKYLMTLYEVVKKFLGELQSIKFGKNYYDFDQHKQASGNSIALSIFQFFYMDRRLALKGTSDLEILEAEREAMTNFLFPVQVTQWRVKEKVLEFYQHYPIPIIFKSRDVKNWQLDFRLSPAKVKYDEKHSLRMIVNGQRVLIYYSGLYKINEIHYIKEGVSQTVSNVFMWGVELITLLHYFGCNWVLYLDIGYEVSYYQSSIFKEFVSSIKHKYLDKDINPCKISILNMILEQFYTKFNQKYFSCQQVIHVNDLPSLMANVIKEEKNLNRVVELREPYYLCDYFSKESSPLCQIGSLARINSYIHACMRSQIIEQMKIKHQVRMFRESNQ